MIARVLWAGVSVLLICLALPTISQSSDIAIVYSIESSESDGEIVRGTMSVQVFNLTDGDLKNVDLRLDLGGANAIARGVLQFGYVEAGGGAVASGDFRLEQGLLDESRPLPWRVDFDDILGGHTSIDVFATRAE